MPCHPTVPKKDRPKIPAKISRAILVEAGYRCAVCGDACPLERAHIVPWRKTHEHKEEDLICLCASCHQRADLENWGEIVLRKYKVNPWVLRRFKDHNASTKRKKIEINIRTERASFLEKDERLLVFALAAFLEIDPSRIKITSIEEGSVKVTIELDGAQAERIVSAFKDPQSKLHDQISNPHVSSIRHARGDLRPSLERELRFPDSEYMEQLLLLQMKSPSGEMRCFAAFRLANLHLEEKRHAKSMFYNRLAEEHAEHASLAQAQVMIYFQRGRILLITPQIQEAMSTYQYALEKMEKPGVILRIYLHSDIGYCHVLLANYGRGFHYLFSACRQLIRLRVRKGPLLASVRACLAFAYLEIDRPYRAQHHARIALQAAESSGYSLGIRNSLYLLGEAEKLCGNELAAHRYFTRLQREFYPDDPVMPDFLSNDANGPFGISLLSKLS